MKDEYTENITLSWFDVSNGSSIDKILKSSTGPNFNNQEVYQTYAARVIREQFCKEFQFFKIISNGGNRMISQEMNKLFMQEMRYN